MMLVFKGSSSKKNIPSETDKNLLSTLNFEYTYPGDNTYVYDFVPSGTMTEQTGTSGTWYAKNTKTGKVFNITKNFPKTAEKLNIEYPSAANPVDKSPKNITTVEPSKLEDNKTAPDLSNIQGKNLKLNLLVPKLTQHKKLFNNKNNNYETNNTGYEQLRYFWTIRNRKGKCKKIIKENLIEVKEERKLEWLKLILLKRDLNFIVEGKSFKTINEQDI